MGIGGFFKKIGRGFQRVGSRVGSVVKRPEVRIFAKFIPIPGLQLAVNVVEMVEENFSEGIKFQNAINILKDDPMFKNMKKSQLNWIVETALQILEERVEIEQ